MTESSIIIPVHNKWELTRNCLKSIAANSDKSGIEVIVIDNASSDATKKACPILGKQLFNDSFRYLRNDQNRNFAGASNQGARIAQGEFLIFLNNDTEVQPGWHDPLIQDFSDYPDIGATGPLLVYPEQTPMGRLVQHLGVMVTPFLKVGHLYNGIPAASPLARKRRFFQVITAACMAIRKSVFFSAGAFNEAFINGFEDVSLCAMLWEKGLRMTVNPDSLVIHHESQTPGRNNHEAHNSALLLDNGLQFLAPDWQFYAKKDGLDLMVDPWLRFQIVLPEKLSTRLDKLAARADAEQLEYLLIENPYWENGWKSLLLKTRDPERRRALFKIFFKNFKNPGNALAAIGIGHSSGDLELMSQGISIVNVYGDSPGATMKNAESASKWCDDIGMHDFAAQLRKWMKGIKQFETDFYLPLCQEFMEFVKNIDLHLNPQTRSSYAMWLYSRSPMPAQCPQIKISLLLPVMDPPTCETLAMLDSIMSQSHENWELVIACGSSLEERDMQVLQEYINKYPRIRMLQDKNCNCRADALNIALANAAYAWVIPLGSPVILMPDALAAMVQSVSQNPGAMLFHCDHDHMDEENVLSNPYFKNGQWDLELLAAQDFVLPLAAFSAKRLKQIQGWQAKFKDACDYDMLLRYMDDGTNAIHIARVLCHIPGDSKNTKSPKDLKNFRLAAQRWLDAQGCGAKAQELANPERIKIAYPLPSRDALVSIIRPEPMSEKLAPSRWPCEIIHAADADAQALNEACAEAKGEILGFLGPGVVPITENWLEDMVSNALRPGIGAVAGKVLNRDDSYAHAGYLTDASGLPQPLFQGALKPDYFEWQDLARAVDALDGLCLFSQKKIFKSLGGFDPDMRGWFVQDYCLRLQQKSLRCIWLPFACFRSRENIKFTPMPEAFAQKWQNRFPAFNPNVYLEDKGLRLRP